jgi:hypothetical protein
VEQALSTPKHYAGNFPFFTKGIQRLAANWNPAEQFGARDKIRRMRTASSRDRIVGESFQLHFAFGFLMRCMHKLLSSHHAPNPLTEAIGSVLSTLGGNKKIAEN